MSAENIKGLAAVDKYYQDYGCRARELKGQGKKIIGYLCAFTPLELISAAGLIPFRIKGNVREPITKADTQMETIICPLVRSCFDVTLKGNYDFLDGLVIPHACDSICRTYDIWKYTLQLPYSHFVNVPHTLSNPSKEFFKEELNLFRKSLSRFTGRELSEEDLIQAIRAYNQNRAKIKELYQLRKSDPPLLSGAEVTKILVAAMGIPVEESSELLSQVIEEVKQRENSLPGGVARIMVVGGQVDDAAFLELVESSGANVVMDDLCPGAREYWAQVDSTKEPIEGIAERYLEKIYCGRTYREKKGSYQEYLEERFGHIGRAIRDFKVNGVIIYLYRYCDPFGFEVPAMKSYIESMGIPVLYLEDEYSLATIGRLRTRVQAFLEMLG